MTLDEKAWLTVSALIHLKGVLLGWGQDSVQASQVLLHHCTMQSDKYRSPGNRQTQTCPSDVSLECSCSAMETHSMKLSAPCSWANLKATWSLEVCRDWLCRKLATSARYARQDSLTPLRHFMWSELLLFPIASTLFLYHWQLVARKFHNWTQVAFQESLPRGCLCAGTYW